MEQELLTLPNPDDALSFFVNGDRIDPLLKTLRDRIDQFKPDVSCNKGRDEIKSFAARIGKAKTAIEKIGKELAAEQKKIPAKIDATRGKIWDTLEDWQKEVRLPLTNWETEEEARIKKHAEAIESINKFGSPGAQDTATMLEGALLIVTEVEIGPECEEFIDEYRMAKDRAFASLQAALTTRVQFEADQAELAKLRQEAADREARDRTEREEREVAERAARAEQEAKEAAERQERETQARIAAEAEKAAQAARDRAARQVALVEANALAERQAAERRERELVESVERAKREAAAAKAAEDAETAKREADKAHKAKINREAVAAFVAGGLTEECAKVAVTLIAKKAIPAIQISY